jgi:hypothetical protein
MKTVWDAAARDEIRDRIARLSPDATRLWGRMTAPQMMAHLVYCMHMANGNMAVASKNLPLRYTPLKQFVIYLAPFPKSAPTAPELVGRAPADWPSECNALCRGMDQFAERDRSGPFPEHPAFGKLTARAWGRLIYRHIDHHLRQFGG